MILVARGGKKAVGAVHEADCAEHDDTETGGAEARAKAKNQSEGADRLTQDNKCSDEGGETHAGQEAHCSVEAGAAEEAEGFLQTVREHDNAKSQAGDEQTVVLGIGVEEPVHARGR